jgi:hypothetical protein
MKTTLDLSENLLKRAKELARREKLTLKSNMGMARFITHGT